MKDRPIRSDRSEYCFDTLEDRAVPAALTAHEQLMLELLNRARANPAAEAARFGIDLNEGLAAGTIGASGKQPLAGNDQLASAIRGHLADMIARDYFSHTSLDGRTFIDRITNAGYTNFVTLAENLGWKGTTGSLDPTSYVIDLHRSLFVDAGISGRGHRINMLNPSHKEVGPGVLTGLFTTGGQTYNSVFVGTDMGSRHGDSILTGVVYTDAVVNDDFYTIQEGLGGVTVTAVSAFGQTFATLTGPAGGYDLRLPAGAYTVTAAGPGLGIAMTESIVIGTSNVKLDFAADQPPPPTVSVIDVTVLEGDSAPTSALVTVTLSRATTKTVHATYQTYDGSALAGRDYQLTNGTVTFAPGMVTQTIVVPIVPDRVQEPTRRFAVQLTSSSDSVLGDSQAMVTLVDNESCDTVGAFDPSSATFFLHNSNTTASAETYFPYGQPHWIPLAGDWNGDGISTIGVFNPSKSKFHLRDTNTTGIGEVIFSFGGPGSIPIAGDWDGDGIETIGVYDRSNSTFHLKKHVRARPG